MFCGNLLQNNKKSRKFITHNGNTWLKIIDCQTISTHIRCHIKTWKVGIAIRHIDKNQSNKHNWYQNHKKKTIQMDSRRKKKKYLLWISFYLKLNFFFELLLALIQTEHKTKTKTEQKNKLIKSNLKMNFIFLAHKWHFKGIICCK